MQICKNKEEFLNLCQNMLLNNAHFNTNTYVIRITNMLLNDI